MAHVAVPEDEGGVGLDHVEGMLAIGWSGHDDMEGERRVSWWRGQDRTSSTLEGSMGRACIEICTQTEESTEVIKRRPHRHRNG